MGTASRERNDLLATKVNVPRHRREYLGRPRLTEGSEGATQSRTMAARSRAARAGCWFVLGGTHHQRPLDQ
jgi:hypothetical protein